MSAEETIPGSVPPRARFCHQCGVALAEVGRFCDACGAPVDPSVPFVGAAPVPVSPVWQPGAPALPPLDTGRQIKRLLIALAGIALVVGGVGVVAWNTGLSERVKPAIPVTFDTVTAYPAQRQVIIVGRLNLPGSLRCDDTCGVYLEDADNANRMIPLFIDVATTANGAQPGQMDPMPGLYSYDDFVVHLSNHTTAGQGDVVEVTGYLCQTEEDPPKVCLNAETFRAGGE